MLRKNVLRRQKDFDSVYNRGRMVPGGSVVLFFKENGLGYERISFLASKKVGNSVERNRARRLMKEAYRLLRPELSGNYDLILVARKKILDQNTRDVMRSISGALKKTGVVR